MKTKLRAILNRFDEDFEMTFTDLVDSVFEIAEESSNTILLEAISRYHQEEWHDRTQLGMRGDIESVENELLELIRSLAGPEKANPKPNPSQGAWDFSLLNEAIKINVLIPLS